MSGRRIPPNTRLRPILRFLLDEFVAAVYPPRLNVTRLAYADLPGRFQVRVDALAPHAKWRAWGDAARVWFMVGYGLYQHEQDSTGLALRVMFFNQDANPIASGEWCRHGPGSWRLHNVLDAEWVAKEVFVRQRPQPDRGSSPRRDRERIRATHSSVLPVALGPQVLSKQH
ncbi:MAG TPA: hypothetical protein VF193_12110 [Steroidobacter sp.]